jgi:hypothetical protein
MSMYEQARRHLSRNLVGYLALFVALGGTSYAATNLGKATVKARNLASDSVSSSKVKNGTLLAKDFKSGQLPKGAKGDKGDPGAAGAAGTAGIPGTPGGLSEAYQTTGNVLSFTGTADLMSLTLPAGNWLVFSHIGSAYNGVVNFARLECAISEPGGSGSDFAKLRFPPNDNATNALVFGDITMHAAVSFTAPTTVKTTCSVVQSADSFTLTTRKMTAVRIGNITTQNP